MTAVRINKKVKKSFENGLNQLSRMNYPKFRKDIEKLLSLNGSTFNSKCRGERALSPSDMNTIEKTFKEYGVTQNIWSSPRK